MNNILITGANGQLGNEMRRLAPQSKSNVYFLTDVDELDIINLEDIRKFIRANHINIIVNCAAYTNVDKAEDDIYNANQINNIAAENLALVCKENGALLVHISTDYVFNGAKNLPYNEDDPAHPIGAYGETKLAGENSILRIGCDHLIFRTSWLYSSYGKNFVKTILRLISEKEKLSVVFDQIGTPTYAADLAINIFRIIEEELYTSHKGLYHFSNEGVCSWYDFAKEIASLSGKTCDIQPCHSSEFPSKVARPIFSILDKSKFKRDFQCTIPYWKDSLMVCINELNQ